MALWFSRTALRALQLRLTPEHPDVIGMKRVIRDLEQKVETDRLDQPLSPEAGGSAEGSDVLAADSVRERIQWSVIIMPRVASRRGM